jgi:hypothetical protein
MGCFHDGSASSSDATKSNLHTKVDTINPDLALDNALEKGIILKRAGGAADGRQDPMYGCSVIAQGVAHSKYEASGLDSDA